MSGQKKRKNSPKARSTRKALSRSNIKTTLLGWYNKGVWQKLLVWFSVLLILTIGVMYSIAQWYIHKHKDEPLRLGATFISDYAQYLGVDPEQTMDAMISELGIRHFRLVTYWRNIEATPGQYDFSDVDWQMEKVRRAGGTVSMAIGLRQPRWPECHWPDWAQQMPDEQWQTELNQFITEVVKRYRTDPILESWQLENEYFLEVFGECPDHTRERLVNEFNLVKRLDPIHPVIVSRSNNATPSWPIGEPRADKVGASIYKRVWDRTVTKRYFEYPYPAWFYAFLAGATELTTNRQTMIHELQAESWTPDGYNNRNATTEELYKSLNPERLRHRFSYGIATGIREIDLWGAEWWYYMKHVRGEPELWDIAVVEFQKARQLN